MIHQGKCYVICSSTKELVEEEKKGDIEVYYERQKFKINLGKPYKHRINFIKWLDNPSPGEEHIRDKVNKGEEYITYHRLKFKDSDDN